MKDLKEIKRKLEELREYIRDTYKAEIISVFGSYARGEQREGSDVDVLVRFHKTPLCLNLSDFPSSLRRSSVSVLTLSPTTR